MSSLKSSMSNFSAFTSEIKRKNNSEALWMEAELRSVANNSSTVVCSSILKPWTLVAKNSGLVEFKYQNL
jgi:hypothetical protein